MALIPFIGRVLSHISSEVELITVNLFYTCELSQGTRAPQPPPQHAQNRRVLGTQPASTTPGPIGKATRNSLKCASLKVLLPAASDLLIDGSRTTPLLCMVKSARNYVLSATK